MNKELKKYLDREDLKDGYVYKIKARNANYGVWIENKNAFMISRWKFKRNYLFLEYHWDYDENFGTVKAIEILDKFKFELQELEKYNGNEIKEILVYLDKLDESLKGVIHKSYSDIQKDRLLRRKTT